MKYQSKIKKLLYLISLVCPVLLVGCSSVVGNVVPQTGPSMEQVYDSMGKRTPRFCEKNAKQNGQKKVSMTQKTQNNPEGFKKISNPELKIYVHPHLSGTNEIPVPGYYTEFNAYDKTHYLLPEE